MNNKPQANNDELLSSRGIIITFLCTIITVLPVLGVIVIIDPNLIIMIVISIAFILGWHYGTLSHEGDVSVFKWWPGPIWSFPAVVFLIIGLLSFSFVNAVALEIIFIWGFLVWNYASQFLYT